MSSENSIIMSNDSGVESSVGIGIGINYRIFSNTNLEVSAITHKGAELKEYTRFSAGMNLVL